ncbi:NUDIX hydrolase [Kyrpidia sp.]|uniref:NUDIX hydrolase n=1 Tax=Kyrpidia sp. TaxID=2073077 RepID=UPI00258F9634|nr:NUDIX hydrolase [Kyrpidia sp.]MCL6575905.1 NUDIX hydrolase [Kyrpidia sp.]
MEMAAGGVVVRQKGGAWEILIIDDRFGHVSLPKGHQDPGETLEQTALREIEEETGVQGEILGAIGTVRYPYTRPDGQSGEKEVQYYLVKARSEVIRPQQEEIAGARWVEAQEALRLQREKGYPNNTPIFEAALRSLDNARGASQ